MKGQKIGKKVINNNSQTRTPCEKMLKVTSGQRNANLKNNIFCTQQAGNNNVKKSYTVEIWTGGYSFPLPLGM